MSAPSAYALEAAFSALMSTRRRLAEDGEITSDFDQVSENAVELLHQTLRAAVEAERMTAAAASRAKELFERAARYANRANTLRAAAFAAMDALGERKIELPDLTASIRAGTVSAILTDVNAIPADYKAEVVTVKINKAAILSALKNGFTVPGAEISNSMPTLSIRTK